MTGLDLMERAGQGVVEAVFEHWPELAHTPHRAVVLCGPGNNGGDGFVVACLLKALEWEVEVVHHGDPLHLPPDATTNYKRWAEIGPIEQATPSVIKAKSRPDVCIDAAFGIGLIRPLVGVFPEIADIVTEWCAQGTRGVAVDTPTGLCADTGQILGIAIPADLTVTFHRAKIGHIIGQGPDICGKLVIKGIGL